MNAPLLPCLFGAADAATITAHIHDESGMRELAARLVDEYDLAEALWRETAATATLLSFQQALLAALPGWQAKCTNSEGYKQALGDIATFVSDWQSRGVQPLKRQIRLRWMSFEVSVTVADLNFEAQLRLHTLLKDAALGQVGWFGDAST